MTRTVRRDLHLFRAGVAGAAAVVLLAACGDGGGSSGANSAGTTQAAGEATDEGAADFCDRAAGIDERVDAALEGMEGDPSIADAFRQIADDLRAIEAPEPITADWASMAAGLDRMADAFGQVDVTDLDSLEVLEQAEGDLTEASSSVDDYLGDECGI
jgi:hypothetical protein